MAELDFLEFLKSNGIDPESLTGNTQRAPEEAAAAEALAAEAEQGDSTQSGLDIQDLLSSALSKVEGKGMDDDVPALINGSEPAALSSGEFVVPANDVALLGDGNSEAGYKVLEEMLNMIRQKKTGNAEQPEKLEDLLASQ